MYRGTQPFLLWEPHCPIVPLPRAAIKLKEIFPSETFMACPQYMLSYRLGFHFLNSHLSGQRWSPAPLLGNTEKQRLGGRTSTWLESPCLFFYFKAELNDLSSLHICTSYKHKHQCKKAIIYTYSYILIHIHIY